METLKSYQGDHCVKLIDADMQHKALLLERAISGESLKYFFPNHDEFAVQCAIEVMKNLHACKPAPGDNFPTIADWFSGLDSCNDADFAQKYIHKARDVVKNLLATQQQTVLLHGDLHHENILSSERGWLAIDPKGVLGDPAYEVCAFIKNPIPDLLKQPNPTTIIAKRLSLFSQFLNVDQSRLRDWCYAQAVLDVCWSEHDEKSKNYFMEFLKIIENM